MSTLSAPSLRVFPPCASPSRSVGLFAAGIVGASAPMAAPSIVGARRFFKHEYRAFFVRMRFQVVKGEFIAR